MQLCSHLSAPKMQQHLHAVMCVITDVTVMSDQGMALVAAAAAPAAALLLYCTPCAMQRVCS